VFFHFLTFFFADACSKRIARLDIPHSRGGVKFPTGGNSPRALFCSQERSADSGGIPEPTVKVWMKENGQDGLARADRYRLGTIW